MNTREYFDVRVRTYTRCLPVDQASGRDASAGSARRAKEEEIPREELNKWVWRLKGALDAAYGHDCDCVNTLEIVVQAIAHIQAQKSKP